MEEEKNKDYGRIDEKLISLPKNFKINLSESGIRLVKKYGTFLIDDYVNVYWSWRKKIFQKLWRFISKKRKKLHKSLEV